MRWNCCDLIATLAEQFALSAIGGGTMDKKADTCSLSQPSGGGHPRTKGFSERQQARCVNWLSGGGLCNAEKRGGQEPKARGD